MPPALSLAPLTLAAVLVLSGVAKLQDPSSTLSALRLLRLPAFVTRRVTAHALPFVELGTAALLLTPWRWSFLVGALLALGLFVTFWLVVVRASRFDPRPTCSCFASIGNHPIDGRTVVRNTLLVALVGPTLWIGLDGTSTGALVSRYTADDVWWLVLALTLAAVTGMVTAGGAPAARTTSGLPEDRDRPPTTPTAPSSAPEGLAPDPAGLPLPRGVVVGRDQAVVPLTHLARGRAQLLVLVNCWCGPTYEALKRLPRWRERLPRLGVQIVVVPYPFAEGRVDPSLTGVWWDPGSRVYDDLGVGTSPGAVLVGADGLLVGGPVNGVEGIDQLVDALDTGAKLAAAGPAAEVSETSPA